MIERDQYPSDGSDGQDDEDNPDAATQIELGKEKVAKDAPATLNHIPASGGDVPVELEIRTPHA